MLNKYEKVIIYYVSSIVLLAIGFNTIYNFIGSLNSKLFVILLIINIKYVVAFFLNFHLKIVLFLILLIFTAIFSIDMMLAISLTLIGILSARVPIFVFYLLLLISFLSLGVGEYGRLSFYQMGPNYTAFFLYLLFLPIIVTFSQNQKIKMYFGRKFNKILKILSLVITLLPESRGVYLSLFSIYILNKISFIRILLITFLLLIFYVFIYALIFPDRGEASDLERFYILDQIISWSVNGIGEGVFNNIFVYSPWRDYTPVMLHNTLATWMFVNPYIFFVSIGYFLLFYKKNILLFFIVCLPSFFISVEPGIFYYFIGITFGYLLIARKNIMLRRTNDNN